MKNIYTIKRNASEIKDIEKAIVGWDILENKENIETLGKAGERGGAEKIYDAISKNIHNPFAQKVDDEKIKLNLFVGMEDETLNILEVIKEADLDGFGDDCFESAEAIMDFFFEEDNENYIVSYFNKFLYDNGIARGHSCVYKNGVYVDSDGEVKTKEEIESWGMIDETDMQNIIEEYSLKEELDELNSKEFESKIDQACYEVKEIFGTLKNNEIIKLDKDKIKKFKEKLKNAEGKLTKNSSVDYRINKIASIKKKAESIKILVPDLNISKELLYHVNNNIKLASNIFRIHSDNYLNIFNEARRLYNSGKIDVCEEDRWLLNTDIGKTAMLNGEVVMLDLPIEVDDDDSYFSKLAAKKSDKKVKLNSPRRIGKNDPGHGRKKFIVHVKDPSTGRIKTVTFGDPNLSIKANNPERRKSFLARHNCDNPGPKTGARYWSCNLHRYKKQLGLKFEGRW